MRIGLLGPPDDAEVDRLADALRDRGAEPLVVDVTELPGGLDVTVNADGEGPPSVRVDGEPVDGVGAWYARRLGLWDPALPRAPDPQAWGDLEEAFPAWHAAETERAMLAGSLLELLHEASAVVNPPDAVWGHLRKHHQATRLQAAGVPVPAFTVTTDPDRAVAFAREHDRVVYKPGAGRRHALEVTAEDVRERRAAFATEPVCLQRLVEGEHHRVHVVGEEVVAAGRVDFDREQGIDYRASEQGVDPVDLDRDLRALCRRAMRACGMSYTGLDLILDEDAEPWVLECNPAPMFAAFEDEVDRPVGDRLAEHLLEAARGA
jgi:hypothetical protein